MRCKIRVYMCVRTRVAVQCATITLRGVRVNITMATIAIDKFAIVNERGCV